jgi:tRNA-splicing ligase RtcB
MLFARFAVTIDGTRLRATLWGEGVDVHAALREWSGRKVVDDLAARGIIVRSPSMRGVAEEAPGAYKDVGAVVAAAEHAGLARRVARLRPLICIKG